MKKAVSLILVFTFLFAGTAALASAPSESREEEIGPLRVEDISKITPTLTVSGTTATYRLTVRAASHVTKLNATLQLQTKTTSGWVNSGSPWPASASSNLLTTSGTKTVATGYTYRLKVTVTPYIGLTAGTSETAYS